MPEAYEIAVKSHLLGRLRLQGAPHRQPVRDTEIMTPEPRGEVVRLTTVARALNL